MFVCPNPHSSDEWEEMCIVPVSKHVAQILEMEEFKSLLSTLGMQCPSDQVYIRTQTHVLHYCTFPPAQEMYWRIPSSMSPDQLEKAMSAIRPGTSDPLESG